MSSSSVLDQETPNRAGTTTAVAGVIGSAIMLNRDPANNNKISDVEYNIVLEEEAEREAIEVKAEALARSTWQNESRGESAKEESIEEKSDGGAAIEESTVKKSDGGESTVKKSAVEEHIVEGAKGEVVHTSDENSDLSSAFNKEGVEIESGGSASDAESILPSESAETQTITPIADSASSPSNAKVSTENNSTSTKRIHWMWWIVLLFLLSFIGWFIIG